MVAQWVLSMLVPSESNYQGTRRLRVLPVSTEVSIAILCPLTQRMKLLAASRECHHGQFL